MDKFGNKTGGRQKGGLNRDKKELREAINAELRKLGFIGEAEEFDAVVMLAVIAMKAFQAGDDQDLSLACKAASECAKYTRPQLRSVTMDADVNVTSADMSGIAAKYDELMRRPAYGLDEAGRRLTLSPSGQLVPETMIDEAGNKFHRGVSGKWAPENEFSTKRAIEYRPGEAVTH